jgi:hypothetical protein
LSHDGILLKTSASPKDNQNKRRFKPAFIGCLIFAEQLGALIAARACSRVCYEENGEGGFTSDLSTSAFASFFASFFAFLISFFASFLTNFLLCFDFFFLAIASVPCCPANDFNITSSHYKRKRGDKPSLTSTFALRGNFDLRLALQPSIDVLTHHIFGKTVALLDYAFKLFALSVDLSQIVLSELAPLLFDLTLSLLPISFDAVPVHFTPPRSK